MRLQIEQAYLEALLDKAAKLDALEVGGVSNWDWYNEALTEYRADKRDIRQALAAAQREAMAPAGGQREEDLARQISETCLVVSKMTLDPEEHPRIRLDEWKTAFLIAQAIREAELRGIKAGLEAAAKININKVGREWVHDSLWDKLANQFAASIRALNPETILEGK